MLANMWSHLTVHTILAHEALFVQLSMNETFYHYIEDSGAVFFSCWEKRMQDQRPLYSVFSPVLPNHREIGLNWRGGQPLEHTGVKQHLWSTGVKQRLGSMGVKPSQDKQTLWNRKLAQDSRLRATLNSKTGKHMIPFMDTASVYKTYIKTSFS